MKIKDHLQELEARRVAFTAMVCDADQPPERREFWEAQLHEVVVEQTVWALDMSEDPFGFAVWFMMEDNEPMRRKAERYRQ